ncbi:MAG TPA: type II toxin-antitoxin system VapC family toxin [Nocardioides sp.]|uniref:type II toxin-antitoxin system VapC family toxin n=1 Tax=Nocardioides sp. TaxID=35761 RepID=UPI002C341211|nr:type II toxin-antitoxin system VapC family toxin [Nocardioides sp.]HQR25477.1 type II toxin-antitoxin system VapC family toxin [Nocardioides sp.]
MKIVDANVLLYAVNEDTPPHDACRTWLQQALTGTEAVGLPWTSLLAFVRISTNPRVFAHPLTAAEASDLVLAWLSQPAAVTVDPTPRHAALLADLLRQAGTAGNLTNDAHLAALALEHNADVVTMDRDLARFQVRVVVPPRPNH